MKDVGTVLLIWLMMWLFNRLPISEPWKSIVNGIVLLLLVLVVCFSVRL